MNMLRSLSLSKWLLASTLLLTIPNSPAALYTGLEPDEFLKSWLAVGPIPVGQPGQEQAFAEDLLAGAGGESDVQPAVGDPVTIQGKEFAWRKVDSGENQIDLKVGQWPEEYAVSYFWADIELAEPIHGVLGIGSDDAVKVWLNGELIHSHWIGRALNPDDDRVPVTVRKGTNRLLLKIQNMQYDGGFSCRLLGEQSQAWALFHAALQGEIEPVQALLDAGAKVDAQNALGLTAWQVAKLRGWNELDAFLVDQGADATRPIPSRDGIAADLFRERYREDGPAAAVLVAQNGRVLFEEARGLANREENTKAALETKFRIGSITKQFTAAAILKLAEEGKLRVEDPLAKYIPDYPRGQEVTIHHLLTHTSGIHSYTSKPEFIAEVTEGVTPEAHIRSFKNDPYDFDPGEKWLYNNSGYFLLGYIIEKVSGRSYAEYLQENFFEPLGMKQTGVYGTSLPLDSEATGYSFTEGKVQKALNWNMSKAGGAGALYSTVGDLFLWNEALFNYRVLSSASLTAAFTPVKTKENENGEPLHTGYGYGWAVQEFRGTREFSHGGGLDGFQSYLLRLPEYNLTVVSLQACSPPPPDANPGGFAYDLTEIFVGDKLAPRPSLKSDPNVTGAALDSLPGRYDYGSATLTVTREGDRLFAQLTGQPRFEIFPRSENTWFWKVTEAEVTFIKNDQGVVTHAIHRQGGLTTKAPKLEEVPEVEVDSEVLEKYVGRYDYGSGKAIMVISREQDQLFAQLTGQPKFPIFPKSKSEFFWKVVEAQVKFVTDKNGDVIKVVHNQEGHQIAAPRLK